MKPQAEQPGRERELLTPRVVDDREEHKDKSGKEETIHSKTTTKAGRKPLFEANKPFDEYEASTNLLELARSY